MKQVISKLFESQLQSHIFHLRTESYSKHIALQEYYESIGNEVDRLCESYQGKYGLIELNKTYNITSDVSDDMVIDYFESLSLFVESERKNLNDGFIESIIDDISELIYSTLYKLKFLK